jgi:hypothetical protein
MLSLAGLTAAALMLGACALGERPTLQEQAPVGDEAAQAVIERLDRPLTGAFVATYLITPSSTDTATNATVSRTTDEVLTIEIGSIVYTLYPDGTATTCSTPGVDCDDFANDAWVSDLGITHRFWGSAFERRIRTDSNRRIGTSAGSVASVAGQSATCAAIKVPSSLDVAGTVTYCALDNGLLARYYGADGIVEMSSFTAG